MQIIAYISMFIDHICKFMFKDFTYNPLLGRLAMPIFAYLIAIGMKRTSNRPKYIFRLFIFALLSQIPFILMVYGTPNFETSNFAQIFNHFTQFFNIGFTFLIATLSIYFIDKNKGNFLNTFIIIIISLFVASELKVDYSIYGIITIYMFYYMESKIAITLTYIFITTIYIFSKSLTPNFTLNAAFLQKLKSYFSIFALPIIFWLKETKKRDNKFLRFLKYAIYPLHMLIIYWVFTFV